MQTSDSREDEMSIEVVVESEKEVPVAHDVDVAVAGSGVAGCFAAIAAARSGVETLLVDRFAYPGGNIGPGMIAGGSLSGGAFRHLNGGFTGIPREFIRRHIERGGGTVPESPNLGDLPPSPHPGDYAKDSGIASYTIMKMLAESGVRTLFSTFIADPILEEGRVCGLFVENKTGRRAVRAKVVVDATGEADVAMRAGAAMIYPESDYADIDGHCPGGSGVCYVVAGVDQGRYEAYVEAEEARGREPDVGRGGWTCREGVVVTRTGPPRRGHQDGRYGHDAEKLTRDEIRMRTSIFETVQRWKEEVPGFEGAYLVSIAPYMGSRGGPCIKGVYTLGPADMLAGRRFDDVVLMFTTRGCFDPEDPERKVDAPWTDFPYRILVPENVDGLLAAGRSASSIPDTLVRGRMMVMHAGQVAGTAAALTAKQGVTPRRLDVKALQRALLEAGFYLGDEARLQALGLAPSALTAGRLSSIS